MPPAIPAVATEAAADPVAMAATPDMGETVAWGAL